MTLWECPFPISDYPAVLMAHGGGGRLTHTLIEQLFLPAFANPALELQHDGAVLELELSGSRLAFATDAFTVSPLFFPGGTIGSLAVHGTVNDLAMCGAQPIALSASFILEEGLPMEDLWRIVQSMQQAARSVGVPIVTGDTKVVDRHKGDGVFITTAGIGHVADGIEISPRRARPGDRVLISGAIAVHGIAILSVREGLEFETTLESDSAPLHHLVARILEVAGAGVHVLRDPTRGGLSSALNEIASQAQVGIRLDESSIPMGEAVRGACELLGLDPLYVANEGKCLVIATPDAAETILATMQAHPQGAESAIIGEVTADHPGRVVMRSRVGGTRVVDMLSGEQLPRIC
ncbi:MAG: hydrogenase expression/formation protein HypE [Chloroflexaceae bacterium]|nr:hydrogenase expression/formation protein HypE [Chloroflexaceae bacterium]